MHFKRQILATLVLVLLNVVAFSQIVKRMEPLNWWEGMVNSRVQIMLYGPKIADLSVKVQGLTVVEQIRTENPAERQLKLTATVTNAGLTGSESTAILEKTTVVA